MTEQQAIDAIKQRWLDTWPGLQPAARSTFKAEVDDATDRWARVTIRPALRVQATMGAPARYDDRGTIFVQLFADIGREDLLLSMAESVRTVYESRDLGGGLVTYAATRREGPDGQREGFEDGRWSMNVMTIPYWFDEVK
jgi:hypothetical protein